MAREEAINTFNDGLLIDMNPLTTPNTVLTDCLNGTMITYNGNEFVLQNDMGNYKLSSAKLKPDYIPVGIKEHGNIIYIVSMNPIDNVCEIGSFPSQQTIFDSQGSQEIQNISPIVLHDDTYNYTDLIKKNTMFIFSSEEDFKLNPGDKYYLYSKKPGSSIDAFQLLNYYILNENKELFKLDHNLIEVNDSAESEWVEPNSDQFVSTKWDIPGWLCAQYNIAGIDSCKIYIKSSKVGPKEKRDLINNPDAYYLNSLSIEFNIQTQVTDPNWNFKELLESLKFRIELLDDNVSWLNQELVKSIDTTPVDYGNGIKTIHSNITLDTSTILLSNPIPEIGNLNLKITPELHLSTETRNTVIIYDNYIQNITIDLSKATDKDNILIANDYYNYIVGKTSTTINFDINNAPENLYGHYRIIGFNNAFKASTVKEDWFEVNPYGQNVIDIPYDFSVKDVVNINKFNKEDIYILLITLCTERDINSKLVYTKCRTLITSEIMNQFVNSYSDYDLISADVWLKNIIENNITDFKLGSSDPNYSITPDDVGESVLNTYTSYYTSNANSIKDIEVKVNINSNDNFSFKQKRILLNDQIGNIGRIWKEANVSTSIYTLLGNVKKNIQNISNNTNREWNVSYNQIMTYDSKWLASSSQKTILNYNRKYLHWNSNASNSKKSTAYVLMPTFPNNEKRAKNRGIVQRINTQAPNYTITTNITNPDEDSSTAYVYTPLDRQQPDNYFGLAYTQSIFSAADWEGGLGINQNNPLRECSIFLWGFWTNRGYYNDGVVDGYNNFGPYQYFIGVRTNNSSKFRFGNIYPDQSEWLGETNQVNISQSNQSNGRDIQYYSKRLNQFTKHIYVVTKVNNINKYLFDIVYVNNIPDTIIVKYDKIINNITLDGIKYNGYNLNTTDSSTGTIAFRNRLTLELGLYLESIGYVFNTYDSKNFDLNSNINYNIEFQLLNNINYNLLLSNLDKFDTNYKNKIDTLYNKELIKINKAISDSTIEEGASPKLVGKIYHDLDEIDYTDTRVISSYNQFISFLKYNSNWYIDETHKQGVAISDGENGVEELGGSFNNSELKLPIYDQSLEIKDVAGLWSKYNKEGVKIE